MCRLPHSKLSRHGLKITGDTLIFNFVSEVPLFNHFPPVLFCVFEVRRSKNFKVLFTPPSGSCCCWFPPLSDSLDSKRSTAVGSLSPRQCPALQPAGRRPCPSVLTQQPAPHSGNMPGEKALHTKAPETSSWLGREPNSAAGSWGAHGLRAFWFDYSS